MGLILNKDLPVIDKLLQENIHVCYTENAEHIEDYIKIAIINLMPLKLDAELDLLRCLSKSEFNIFIEFIKITSRESIRKCNEYIQKCYKSIDEIKYNYFDGVIITGAPVENLEYEQVDYWYELKEIMDYSRLNIKSTFHICWAAQAGLYNFYNINKKKLNEKCFGVFEHKVNVQSKITSQFDKSFFAPHSRHTTIDIKEVLKQDILNVVSYSDEAGIYIIEDNKDIFVMGHSEYDKYTLDKEYKRDLNKGIKINVPKNYYENDDFDKEPTNIWSSHSHKLFTNWIKYYLI